MCDLGISCLWCGSYVTLEKSREDKDRAYIWRGWGKQDIQTEFLYGDILESDHLESRLLNSWDLATLFQSDRLSFYRVDGVMIVNDELGRVWKKAACKV